MTMRSSSAARKNAPRSADRAGRSILRDDRARRPDGFRRAAVRRAPRRRISLRYDAARTRGARRARPGRFCGAQAGRAEDPLRRTPAAAGGERLKVDLGDRDRQRRHAVPGRLGDGRTGRARPRRAAGRASDLRGRARRGRQARRRSTGEAGDATGEPRESFIHIHVDRIDDEARRAEIVQALEQVLADVRRRVQDWRPMLGRVARRDRRAEGQSAAAAGRRDRRGDPVPANGWSPTISPSSACATTRSPARTRLEPVHETGLGVLRAPRCAGAARAATSSSPITPEIRAFLERAEGADRHQGECALARASPRLSWTTSASSASTPTASWSANSASSACSPRPPIRARPRTIPYLRRKVDAVLDARRLRSRRAIPARRWSTCWRPIRATSCSRSTRTRSISSRMAILQLDERPRVRVLARRDRFDRFVSVLVYRAARPLRQRRARRDRRVSGRGLQGPRLRPSIRSSRKGRWCACISSSAASAGETPESRPRRRWKTAVAAIVRTWTDAFADALAPALRAGAGARAVRRAIATRSPPAIARPIRRRSRSATSASSKALSAGAAARRRFPSPRRATSSTRRPEGLELRPADPAVGARAGAGEHGLPRRRRAHLSRSARRGADARCLVARHDAGARRRRADRSRRAAERAGSRVPGGDARRRRERRLQRAGARRPGCGGATSR